MHDFEQDEGSTRGEAESGADAPGGGGDAPGYGAHPSIVEAFGLYMDGAGYDTISELTGIPKKRVQKLVSERRTVIGGIECSWRELREAAEAKRARLASDRQRDQTRFQYDQWRNRYNESVAEKLEQAMNSIIEGLDERTALGDFAVKRSVGDLERLAKTGLLIQGRATEIVETQTKMVQVFATLIQRHAELHFHEAPDKVQRFLSSIADDFDRIVAAGPEAEVQLLEAPASSDNY